ncbi:MAG: MOP flippase family protein [Leptothrix sp. (in: b-proteobacteria)]
MNLRAQAMAGVRWTTLSSIGRAILQFLQIIVLSRFLTPAEFGLIALVTSTVAVIQIFADAGVSNAIIHQQEISADQNSSLYWFNVICSALLALLLGLCSPYMAAWYEQPALVSLVLMAAATLLINSLAQQLKLQAQKRLDFHKLAKVELFAAGFGFVAATMLAWHGAGASAMMAGTLATAFFSTLLSWLTLANGWRPQIRLNFEEIREFIHFGLYMIGNNLANALNSQIDIFLGSKLLGTSSVGLYSLPREINLRVAGLINPIITQVAFPIMAKAQEDEDLLRRIYLQIMRMTASINFPIYVFLGLFAPDIIGALFGPKWHDSVPLVQILSIWALIRSTVNPVGSLLMARGRADISFKWNMMMLGLMPIAVWAGSHYGISGIATAMTGTMVLTYWPNWRFQVYPLCKVTLSEYTYQIIVPLVLSLLAAMVCFYIVQTIGLDISRIFISIVMYFSIYLLLSKKFNNEFFSNAATIFRFKKTQ